MPPKTKPNPKKASSRKMPPPLPKGEVLVDGIKKQQWIIGTSVGKGGFGEIYTAAPKGQDLKDAQHVIKIEPHENGPLFSELSYYRRAAKPEMIDGWVGKMKLTYLPIPKYITSGLHDFQGLKFRFLVMKRFGEDIEKHFTAAGRKFCEDTVCYLALRLLEGLQFLHESEYVHADVKGSNLLTGYGHEADRVYLVDYGLAYRYKPEGEHKDYKEDPKRCHDGTIEFTSIDAHNGVSPSRRSDLEILGYCLLQWGCGTLPWEGNLKDANYVANAKKEYRTNVGKLIADCQGPKFLLTFMTEVYKLGYEEAPDYPKLMKIFTNQLHGRDPKKTLEWLPGAKKPSRVGTSISMPAVKLARKRTSSEARLAGSPPKRARKAAPAKRVRKVIPKASKVKHKSSPAEDEAGPSGETDHVDRGKARRPVTSLKGKKGTRKGRLVPESIDFPTIALPEELGHTSPRRAKRQTLHESNSSPGTRRSARNQNNRVDYKEHDLSYESERAAAGKRNRQESNDDDDLHHGSPRNVAAKGKRKRR